MDVLHCFTRSFPKQKPHGTSGSGLRDRVSAHCTQPEDIPKSPGVSLDPLDRPWGQELTFWESLVFSERKR